MLESERQELDQLRQELGAVADQAERLLRVLVELRMVSRPLKLTAEQEACFARIMSQTHGAGGRAVGPRNRTRPA